VKFEVGDITAFVIPSEVEKSFGNESDSSAPLRSGRNDKEDKRSGRNDKEDKRSSGNDNTKNGFDLVLLVAVLHHLPTKKLRLKVLENIHQALKPGGRLVMVNWNLWQIFGWKKKFRYWPYLFNWPEKIKCGVWGVSDAFVPWKPAGKETRRYIHSFTKGETRRLLRRAGFAIEELEFKAKGDNKKGIMYGDNLLSIAVKNGKM
jgi:SAM-dependent methyltransferase